MCARSPALLAEPARRNGAGQLREKTRQTGLRCPAPSKVKG
jgi:hypothetical protein